MRVSLIGAQALLLATRLLNALQALLNSVETLKHLQQNPPFDTTDLFTSNSDAVKANVWDYQAYVDAAASSSTRVASATLLELVALMTDSKPADSEFSDAFLLTCHDVSSPDEILSLLMARFHAVGLPAGFDEERLLRVRRRVLSVLMRWVGLKWKDLSEGTMIKVYGFLDSVERGKEYAELAQLLIDLRAELDRTLALRQAMERDHANSLLRQPVLSLNALVPLQFFLSTPETVLAEQMTLLDFEHYCAIQSSELLHQSWVNPEQRIECLGISAMFERLNSLGHWVASMALLHDRKKARAALLSKVIRVGEALLALNNFNSLAGFVAGCCMAPVDRLRHSWKYVPKRDRELLGQFTQLLGPAKSYSAYRGAVLARNPPICPYIGVYLSDLTLIDEGNPNLVDGGRINWQKRELESRVIGELLVYQNVPYSSLQSNPAVAQYLISLPCLPVAVLQELSLAYEPRGAESSDVL